MYKLGSLLFLLIACSLFAQDSFVVSGIGESTIEAARRKKDKVRNAEIAYDQAERNARKDAARQAIFNVYGAKSTMSAEELNKMEDLMTRGMTIINDHDITDVERTDTYIKVTLSARVSRIAILEILKNAGISIIQKSENNIRVHVLAYTVEGVDADPTKPILLREEIRDNRKNIQSSASSSDVIRADSQFSDNTDASSASRSDALDYRDREAQQSEAAYSNQGHLKASAAEEGQVDARYEGASEAEVAYGNEQAGASARDARSAAGSVAGAYSGESAVDAAYDERGSAKSAQASDTQLKTQSASEEAEYQRDINAKSTFKNDQHAEAKFRDTSTNYYRLREYSDPTKKGSAQTNEVRAVLSGLFQTEGLSTNTPNVPLMGKTFNNEDELIDTVWKALQNNPPKGDEDHFIAIALNRLTPIPVASGLKKFDAAITYRVFRLRDGYDLIASKVLTGHSGETNSLDTARIDATKNALMRAKDIIRKDIVAGFKKYDRQLTSKAASSSFTMVIKNAANPFAAKEMEQQLKAAGFEISRAFKSRTLTFEILLAGKSAEDVFQAAAEFLENRCDFESMDTERAELVLK